MAECFSDTSVSKKKTVRFHRLEDHSLSSNSRKNLNTSDDPAFACLPLLFVECIRFEIFHFVPVWLMDIDSVSYEAKTPTMKTNVSRVLARLRSNREMEILRELAVD